MDLIHSSKFYAIYQSGQERAFYLDMGQKTLRLRFCQLLAIRRRLGEIAIESHFDSDLNAHGFEILTLCNKEHLFVLNTLEILDLKGLIQETFILLESGAQALLAPSK
jgi:hypothetical protein